MKEKITLEINGVEIKSVVEFDYTPPVKKMVSRLPEDCYPEEPEVYELYGLDCECGDLSGLLGCEEVVDTIIEQIKEAE